MLMTSLVSPDDVHRIFLLISAHLHLTISNLLDRVIEEKKYVNARIIEMLQEGTSPGRRPVPMVVPERVFQTVMYGWAKLCRNFIVAQQRMREVLEIMIEEATYDGEIQREIEKAVIRSQQFDEDEHNGNKPNQHAQPLSCQPTVVTYNTLLQGLSLASHRSIAAAIEAEHVLHRMDRIHRRKGWHTKPNTRSFMLVINAFSQTRHQTAGERAEKILRKMIDFHIKEKAKYEEDTGLEYKHGDTKKIVTPDAIAYAAVIKAYADSNSDGSALNALRLLLELLKSEEFSSQVDPHIFANTIHAFSKAVEKKKSGMSRLAAAEKAEQIFWVMVDELKRKRQNDARSIDDVDQSLVSVDTTAEGIGKSRNYEENATGDDDNSDPESLEMSTSTSLAPRDSAVVALNACLNTWSLSNTKESATRAEFLLRKILEDPNLQDITGIRPNSRSFNSCLNAWARASKHNQDAAQKAEKLLHEMIEESRNLDPMDMDGIPRIQPDVYSFTAVMSAHGRSNNKQKTMRVRQLLDELVGMRLPSIINTMSAVPYTVVLNAAAHSDPCKVVDDGTLDAFGALQEDDNSSPVKDPYTIAQETYADLCQDAHELGVAPDHQSFASMLDVVGQHTAAESVERRQMVENVFEDACIAGQVSSLVIRALKKTCPSQEMLERLLQKSITSDSLPREWTRHVPPRFCN